MPSYSNYFLLSRDDGSLLVEVEGRRVRLPRFPAPTNESKYQLVERFVASVRDRFGLEVFCTGKISSYPSDPPHAYDFYYGFDCLGAESTPRGCRWVLEEELPGEAFARDGQSAAITEWVERRAAARKGLAETWQQPGWFTGVRDWIHAVVPSARSLVQLIAWDRSVIIRVTTDSETVYFKACPRSAVYETGLTSTLADWEPSRLPQLVEVDVDRGWMLTRDYGPMLGARLTSGRLREEEKEVEYSRALGEYAALQIAVSGRERELLALGCEDRRLGRIAQDYPSVVEFARGVPQRTQVLIDAAAFDRLAALAPKVTELCDRLDALGLPSTIEHGDLHLSQIAGGTPFVFTDWSDATVSHPFLSVPPALQWSAWAFLERDRASASASAAYLAQWGNKGSAGDLSAGLAAAEPLAMIHRANNYRRLSSFADRPQDWTLNVVGYLSRASMSLSRL